MYLGCAHLTQAKYLKRAHCTQLSFNFLVPGLRASHAGQIQWLGGGVAARRWLGGGSRRLGGSWRLGSGLWWLAATQW